MDPSSKERYLIIHGDEEYIIWVDSERQIASIFIQEGGQMLVFTGDDFYNFREAINKSWHTAMAADDELRSTDEKWTTARL